MSYDPDHRLYVHSRERAWWGEVASATYEWHDSRACAGQAEKLAIRAERPRYNVAHTDLHRRVSGFTLDLSHAEIARWAATDTWSGRMAGREMEKSGAGGS